MPKSCYLLLLVFGLLLSGCGGGSGGSASGEAPAITQEQSQALEEVRLKAGDVPNFSREASREIFDSTRTSDGEERILRTAEEWNSSDTGFRVYYTVYDQDEQAAEILQSSMEHHPFKPELNDLKGRKIWQIQRPGHCQIYFALGRVIVNLAGPDGATLSQVCGKLFEKRPPAVKQNRAAQSALQAASPSDTASEGSRLTGKPFTAVANLLYRCRPSFTPFLAMPVINGLPTAFMAYNPYRNLQNLTGIPPQEYNDEVFYRQIYDYTIPAELGDYCYRNAVTQAWADSIPEQNQTYTYNDGHSYTCYWLLRHVHTNYWHIFANESGYLVRSAHYTAEDYVNNYENYQYEARPGYVTGMGEVSRGWGRPGKYQLLDEAYENQYLKARFTRGYCIRGLYVQALNQEAVSADETGSYKFNFQLNGVPTPPAGDGLDEAGWAPFNPKWRLVIYNEEGGEVRILSGQAASMGVNQIPLEVTWDGKDSQENPAEAGNYTYKLFCLEQSDGLGYGVAQGNLTVGEPVLELYDEDDNLIASSEDEAPDPATIVFEQYPPYPGDYLASTSSSLKNRSNITFPYPTYYVFLKKHTETKPIAIILKNGPLDKSEITVNVATSATEQDPITITLTKISSGTFKGTIKIGPNHTDDCLKIDKFNNSFYSQDLTATEDSDLFKNTMYAQNYTSLGRTDNFSIYVDSNAIPPLYETFLAAGYEDLIVSYKNGIITNKAKLHVQNQAGVLYYSGHGDHETNSILTEASFFYPKQEIYITPNDLHDSWKDNLKLIYFVCCSILDIGNYNNNGNYDFPSPGYYWQQKTNSDTVLLGYNYVAPSGKVTPTSDNVDTLILQEYYNLNTASNSNAYAWVKANANIAERFNNTSADNACAIEDGYYYFIKYEKKTMPKAEVNLANIKYMKHYNRKIIKIPIILKDYKFKELNLMQYKILENNMPYVEYPPNYDKQGASLL